MTFWALQTQVGGKQICREDAELVVCPMIENENAEPQLNKMTENSIEMISKFLKIDFVDFTPYKINIYKKIDYINI